MKATNISSFELKKWRRRSAVVREITFRSSATILHDKITIMYRVLMLVLDRFKQTAPSVFIRQSYQLILMTEVSEAKVRFHLKQVQ